MSSENIIESIDPIRADALIPWEWVVIDSAVMRVAVREPATSAPNCTRLVFDHWHGRNDEYPVETRELVVPSDQMISRVHMVRFITDPQRQ